MVIGYDGGDNDNGRQQRFLIDDMEPGIDEWMETQWGCPTEAVLAWGTWTRLPIGKTNFQSHACELDEASTVQCTDRFEHEPVA